MLHVFLGTKAQYIKTAPVLRVLDARSVPYRLIDSGQHASISATMRADLGVREPDLRLGGDTDVDSVPGAMRWAVAIAARLSSRDKVKAEIFGGRGGLCVIHGDTPSTLLAALLARRAGLRIAHLEAGLRSGSLAHPFPEELIRVLVMRWADVLFAPDAHAVANLRAMGVRGRVIENSANTSLDTLRRSLASPLDTGAEARGPAVMTMHRVENIHRRSILRQFVELVSLAAATGPVHFVVHGPTRKALERHGDLARLSAAGVQISSLLPHGEFTRLLQAARFVVTDGGSIQEECALLGVPTLLWRERTERRDGLGRNVVLSRYDRATISSFLAEPERWRCPSSMADVNPSEEIAEVLIAESSATSVERTRAAGPRRRR